MLGEICLALRLVPIELVPEDHGGGSHGGDKIAVLVRFIDPGSEAGSIVAAEMTADSPQSATPVRMTGPAPGPLFPPPLAPGDQLAPREIAAAMRRNVLAAFTARAFEEEVLTRRLFGHEQLTLNGPDAIRHVLIDNPDNYRRTPATIRLLYPIIGRGLFLADGAEWREQRRAMAPGFAPRTIPVLAGHVAAATDALVAELHAEPGDTDILEHMHRLAIEIAGRSMFSLGMSEFGPRMREMLHGYSERLGRPTLPDIILPPWIPTWRDFGRWRFRRRWLALIAEIVAARQAKPHDPERSDLLDLIASDSDTNPETGRPISPALLADQVATMIAAGHATTAIALFWTLYLLASVPEAQQRVAAEAAPLDLSPLGAADALARLPYTRAVVSESLRLYPPAYAVFRQARRADTAGGVAIPAGAVIMIAPWLLHRHRNLWSDPDRFDPGRFLPGAPPPDRFAYLPFGVGPRVCIGAQFALTEAVLVTARLVKEFHIARADDEPVAPVAAITVQPDRAPPFRLTPLK